VELQQDQLVQERHKQLKILRKLWLYNVSSLIAQMV
jgi:hypothetical protein